MLVIIRAPFLRAAHYSAMTRSIAFVGAGPTTIYTLHALLDRSTAPFSLTIFEEQPTAGRGTPYRPGWNDPAMLSNIASIEIPALEMTLIDWLRAQPASRLLALGIDPDEIGERTFYPRLALGDFFTDQFHAVLDRAKARGISVDVRTRCRIVDAISEQTAMKLIVRARSGALSEARFDHVVLATGHQWPEDPQARPGYYLSPWPASALADIAPTQIGIRGTSLSAIDAAVALAVSHGEFTEDGEDQLIYEPAPGTDEFHMTMMSRKGLLPEADFFAPLPYEPLSICTPEAMEALIAADGLLLDPAFALFKQELIAADPDYAARTDLANLELEDFCERYFAERADVDPFEWAETNLAEARWNYEREHTVPWRYAILRMHEVLALIVPHLDAEEYRRFAKHFKPVFVDDYATVPHESIRRMLALHRAGKLDVLAIGDDYRIDSHRPEGGAVVTAMSKRHAFPIFIEATGQRPLQAKSFPFPSLLQQGIVRDAQPGAPAGASRGIAIDDQFHPVSDAIPEDQLFCLSLPFLLGRHPFIQGITSSHEMGLVVAEQLAMALLRATPPAPANDEGEIAA
ncbi:FAD/NAD(P)-binding protein [Sphingopyxis sp.]|uniref:FAD/NAD(P)-binding protein n=1 Tax=Sphingopyxis sp. TaxID=1908224 RepID=UPI003BAD8ACA